MFWLMNVEDYNAGSTNWAMAAGDVVRLLVTNIHGEFRYKIISYIQ
jgi:hypothetical protein